MTDLTEGLQQEVEHLRAENSRLQRAISDGALLAFAAQPPPVLIGNCDAEILRRLRILEKALREFPFHEWAEAIREGADADGAWDVFLKIGRAHVEKALREAGMKEAAHGEV